MARIKDIGADENDDLEDGEHPLGHLGETSLKAPSSIPANSYKAPARTNLEDGHGV